MKNSKDSFFRQATPEEMQMIKIVEEARYQKERRTMLILLIFSSISVVLALYFLLGNTNWTLLRSIVFLVLAVSVTIISSASLKLNSRQINSIRAGKYKVQNIVVTKTRNITHGLISDMYVTLQNEAGQTYEFNTHTTNDGLLTHGIKGLFLLIDNEKTQLLVNNYRFYTEV